MSKNIVLPIYTKEIAMPLLPLDRGMKNDAVKRVQEWLVLAGHNLVIDGDYGPATAAAVAKAKEAGHVGNPPYNGDVVDAATWNEISRSLTTAVARIEGQEQFARAVVVAAERYLNAKAREVGGDNKGVWQRHFSRGRENQPWCQDFASTCWFDAARGVFAMELPFPLCDDNGVASSYVPWVANEARRAAKFVPGTRVANILPGSMFFVRTGNPSVPYSHVGIVVADRGDRVETIEGNTNDDGSANGYKVCRRSRPKSSLDFGVAV